MIKKLDFTKSKNIGEDFDVISDKIDEIIDAVNEISEHIKLLKTNNLVIDSMATKLRATISDLQAYEASYMDIKANETKFSEIISDEKVKVSRVTSIENGTKKQTSVLLDVEGNINLKIKDEGKQ
jgi:prophage DNA circulation protein